VPFDWQAHDTGFVTAHLHSVLIGGFVFPMLAGLYYWLPQPTGRKRSFRIGEMAALSTQSLARIRAWIWRYDRAPLSIAMIENRMTPTWP
jgi:heme/copper-type cytochrome/quinol oxidase subunit 1